MDSNEQNSLRVERHKVKGSGLSVGAELLGTHVNTRCDVGEMLRDERK